MTQVLSRVVEVVVFCRTGDSARVLIMRRAPEEPLNPGIWQIITGTLEGEETAVEGALREVVEETGLKPSRMWSVPFVNSFFDRKRNAVQLIPWFAVEVDPGAEVCLSEEHVEFQWTSFERAASLMAWPGQRQGIGIVQEEIAGGGPASSLTEIPL
jgi:dihydroneopterin triphosphate diphosphatase